MANMVGRLRLTIDVPFDYVIEEPDENGHSPSRGDAAKFAETYVTDRIKGLLVGYGKIVDTLVEEVRDAE